MKIQVIGEPKIILSVNAASVVKSPAIKAFGAAQRDNATSWELIASVCLSRHTRSNAMGCA